MMEWSTYYTEMEDLKRLQERGITTILVGEFFLATRIPVRSSWSEIHKISHCCDQLGLKLGIVMNRIFFDEDVKALQQGLEECKKMKIHRIDYTDPAVYIEAEKLGLKSFLNYNPDTLMCNRYDVQLYLDLGIDGVVLSKEMTLEEMIQIAQHTSGSIEMIAHGRLNMAYSRRYLVSSYLDHIEKKGSVQDCQDLVLVETTRQGRMPIIEDEQGTTVFTDYTLCSYREFQQLVEAGITRFRFDNLFCPMEEFLDCLEGYQRVVKQEKAKLVEQEMKMKYPHLVLDSGYMYKKTNLIKGEKE